MAKKSKRDKRIEVVASEGEELPLLKEEILGELEIPPEKEAKEVVSEEEVEEFSPEGEIEKLVEKYKDSIEIVEDVVPLIPTGMVSIKYLGTVDVFIIKGPVTGQRYRFTAKNRTGTIVAIKDYKGLLQRARPARKCCGGRSSIPEMPYFGPV